MKGFKAFILRGNVVGLSSVPLAAGRCAFCTVEQP